MDPRLVLAYEENQERVRALAYRKKGLRPRRLVLRNIFAMDLRSAHKITEKPPPRLRLSLTRSMSTDVDHRPIRGRRKLRMVKRRAEGVSNKVIRPVVKTEEVLEADWGGTSEEEKQGSDSNTEDRCEDSIYGQSECSSPPTLQRQDLELDPLEKTEGTDTWDMTVSEAQKEDTSVTGNNQTFANDQSKDSSCVPEVGTGDVVTVCSEEEEEEEEEGVEQLSECPRLENCDFQRSNATSVIVSPRGRQAGETVPVCAPAQVKQEEVRGDNQHVSAPTQNPDSETPENPRKVIVTEVTLNSLTVTFKEATVAEGFFKHY